MAAALPNALLRAAGVLALLASLASGAAPQGENRLWWAEFQLSGPLETLRIDCGTDGATLLEARLLAGEERSVRLPLPVRSPEGADGLAALPRPRTEVGPEGASDARFLGWAGAQPATGFRNLGPALRARTRPPVTPSDLVLGVAELALLGATLGLVWSLRRRTGWMLALAVGASAVLWGLAGRARSDARVTQVLEWDVARGRGFVQRAALDELALPTDHLEARPVGSALTFHVILEGAGVRGRVTAPGVALVGMDVQRAQAWSPERAPPEPLAAVWFRTTAGRWVADDRWPVAAQAAEAGGRASPGAPPGWLVAGLPPGRTLFVARAAGEVERWVRITGFPAP